MKKVKQNYDPSMITVKYDTDITPLTMSELIRKMELLDRNIKGITHVKNINEFMSRPCTI